MLIADGVLQSVLAPPEPDWEQSDGLRPAAVLAPLVRRGDADVLLLTRRRRDLPAHPGQVAFPGGAREGGEGPISCALRETEEEIGLPADLVTVLGALPQRRSTSGFLVHAYVGRVTAPFELRLEPTEVEAILEVPLAELLVLDRWELRAPSRAGRTFPVSPHFSWREDIVWGLTGRLVYDLVQALAAVAG